MFLQDSDPLLGSWLSDAVGWVKDRVTGSPNGFSVTSSPGGTASNDLAIVRAWVDQARGNGTVATRMPTAAHAELVNHVIIELGAGSANAGRLAARHTGPGTWYPTDTPLVYELAPANALAADARIQAGLASDQTGTLLEAMKSLGLAPGIAGNNDDGLFSEEMRKYLMWGAVGVGVLVLLPYVLPPRRR